VWTIEGDNLRVTEEGVTTEYVLKKIIGKGRYGEARLLVDKTTNRPVILKTSSKVVIKNFEKEVGAMRQLEHPNIVEFMGAFEDAENVHLLMEYADGGDLKQKIQRGPLEEGVIIRVLYQLLQAVAYIHERNIVHKDIKPDNILLDAHENVKLGDFGTA